MRVQRVLMPGSEAESWTVLGDDQVPLEPVERFLGYLTSIEKSPNTVKAYAHDLKDWFTYLAGHDLDWQAVCIEDVAGFVAWLRLPPQRPRWHRRGTAGSRGPLLGGQREPQTGGPDLVLRVPRPPRGEPGWAADHLAASGPSRVSDVL